MALFYHVLGLGLMYAGSYVASSIIPGYEIPQIPVSVLLALSSGVLEESVFFGIPLYLYGHPLAVLGSGIVWSAAHLFNASMFSATSLSYSGFLLVIPHLFFSIRIWSSGKGWFAIVFHCIWNLAFLVSFCSMDLRQCNLTGNYLDLLNVVMAASTLLIVCLAYKNKKMPISRYLYLIPVGVILMSLVLFFWVELFFEFPLEFPV